MNRQVATRALIGAVLAGVVAAGFIWACAPRADAGGVVIISIVYAAAGAVAGIASLWRQRGLPPLTCVAVVVACMLVARLATLLVVGFRKFNDYPASPMIVAAVVGVAFVLACRKPVIPGSIAIENGDQDHRSAGESSEHQGSNAQV